jgi:hypothetical protein
LRIYTAICCAANLPRNTSQRCHWFHPNCCHPSQHHQFKGPKWRSIHQGGWHTWHTCVLAPVVGAGDPSSCTQLYTIQDVACMLLMIWSISGRLHSTVWTCSVPSLQTVACDAVGYTGSITATCVPSDSGTATYTTSGSCTTVSTSALSCVAQEGWVHLY